MEQAKNKIILTKPNAFIKSLQSNSAITIASMAHCTATQLEQRIDQAQALRSELEHLQGSLRFFEQEYQGDDAPKLQMAVFNQMVQVERQLTQQREPQSLGSLMRQEPDEALLGLKIIINDLRLFFQVDSMISNEGIHSLCPLILGEYASLSLEEIALCFAQAKKGWYGEVYNRLDGQVILRWLRLYAADKYDRRQLQAQNQHLQSKADIQRRERGTSPSEALRLAQAAVEVEKASPSPSKGGG